jgi:hypothetical protein
VGSSGFTGAAFTGGTFQGLTVSGTTITASVGFTGAAFTGGTFTGTTFGASSSMTAPNFTGTTFIGTTFSGGTHTGLFNGTFSGSTFTGGTFYGGTGTTVSVDNIIGNVYVSGLAVNAGTNGVSSVGDVVAYASDDRLKTKLGNIQGALEKVKALNGFQYKWNDLAQGMGMDDNTHVGLSAQEVQKVLPEVIRQAPINNEYLTIQYEKLVPLLIEAIKELHNLHQLYKVL